MKGLFEEYATMIVGIVVGLIVLSFVLTSAMSPTGQLHKYVVLHLQSQGLVSTNVIEEWDIGTIKATFKDDGGLYLTGSGTLPTYSDVKDTPWASMAKYIDFVKVEDGIVVVGEVPIK